MPTLLEQAEALAQALIRLDADIFDLRVEMGRILTAIELHKDALTRMVETGEGTAP